MPLYMNGTLIPENVANALTMNGVDITDVFFNGVQVWNQTLFSATWSGNSIVPSGQRGFEVSGSLIRAYNQGSKIANWLSANSDGTFENGETKPAELFSIGLAMGGSYTTPANGIRVVYHGASTQAADTYVSFDKITGFTGTSYGSITYNLTTSGGLVRYQEASEYGTFESLT